MKPTSRQSSRADKAARSELASRGFKSPSKTLAVLKKAGLRSVEHDAPRIDSDPSTDGVEVSCADYAKLTNLKTLLLTHGKAIDAAHDKLSEAIETDESNDDIRDAGRDLCLVLNAFHEARRAALGDDGVLRLYPVPAGIEQPDHERGSPNA